MTEHYDPVIGKIVIDVSRKYLSIYFCDGDGTVRDTDHFRFPWRQDVRDAQRETRDLYHRIFDWANWAVNSASQGGGGPTVKE